MVASIRPSRPGDNGINIEMNRDGFIATNVTVETLIELAYNAKTEDQIAGAPSWIKSDKYDIEAKIEDSLVEKLDKLPDDKRGDQLRLMLQSLLVSRLKLKANFATKERLAYVLVVAKNGPKLTESSAGATDLTISREWKRENRRLQRNHW